VQSTTVTVEAPGLGWKSTHEAQFWLTNALQLALQPGSEGLELTVEGEGLEGTTAELTGDLTAKAPQPLAGGKAAWKLELPREYRAGAVLRQSGAVVGTLPEARFVRIEDFSGSAERYRVPLDGNAQVSGRATLTFEEAGPNPRFPRAAVLHYQVGEGWKYVQVNPGNPMPIDGQPRAAGFWLWSDGGSTGDAVRLRFRDATGQTFQPSLPKPLSGTGWRWVTLPLDGRDSGSWGGARDGVVHYPIAWETLLLVDSHRRPHAGEVRVSGYTLLY
jgi:hypothetical protein